MSRHDALRTKFLHGMSQLYQAEVPLYRQLVKIVQKQNHLTTSDLDDGGGRVEVKRHGAIRLGPPQELHTISRVFGLIWACHLNEHPILSDNAAFSTAHINHLTLRALDVTAVQKDIVRQGTGAKSHIEGPLERASYEEITADEFKDFPDDWETPRRQGLEVV
ncbi:duf1338 domain-containing protein [Fusarium albosuccineum]|uniref:2-oxoadipate dioxygenase/decarboxylase n=1 Tax=Fusarium albosuccineum TaxID=1237068 RepID=A0A8H4LMM2_9HYPO|nr:duf1338 domain-containing protein [Fusarium albosuccineum]